MSAARNIPQRMCVVCRQVKPKKELVRIVYADDGVTVDITGKMNGRGVYLCKCRDCIDKALKSKGFVKQHGFSLDTVAEQLENLIER